MDIKAKIEEVVAKIKANPNLLADFKSNPIKVVESIIGVDIPDDVENQIVSGVKGALAKADVQDAASGVVDKVKGLFGN